MHIPKKHDWNLGTCICEDISYWKSIVDNSVIECDEIMNATNVTFIDVTDISTNVTDGTSICEASRYWESIIDNSVNECYEIINVTDVTFTDVTDVSTNILSIVSKNCDDKKVRYKMAFFYFEHVFISVYIAIYICSYLLSLHKPKKTVTYCKYKNDK